MGHPRLRRATAPTPSPHLQHSRPAPGASRSIRPPAYRKRQRWHRARPLRSHRKSERACPADPRLQVSRQEAVHRDLSLDAAQPPHGDRASRICTSRTRSSAASTSDSARRPAPAPRPMRSTKTTGSAHDPQSGSATGPWLRGPRHHDAVHGQGRLAHQRPRRHSHFGDIGSLTWSAHLHARRSHSRAPGVALGARLQGRNVAVMTYIGDGGQSTGVTYEGINSAAVQNLGLVLFVKQSLGLLHAVGNAVPRAKTSPNAPSPTAFPASSSTAPTPARFTTPPAKPSSAPIAAKAPRSSKPK